MTGPCSTDGTDDGEDAQGAGRDGSAEIMREVEEIADPVSYRGGVRLADCLMSGVAVFGPK